MVRLTTAFLSNKISNSKIRQSKEKDKYLRKVTHLQLQDKFIDTIGDFSDCKKLTVLYLHNNCLTKIDNLQHAVNLTHLYLQKNRIKKMENLVGLRKLKKLYLGHNCIAVVEGLESLAALEELHVEKQHLPMGETLYFDPRSVSELAKCLRILNISGNGLQTILDLSPLQQLNCFIARDNRLSDMDGIMRTLSKWYPLRELELVGNPVCSQHKYRENLIAVSARLELLDEKKVLDTTREFVKRLELNKAERQLHGLYREPSPHSFTADIDNLTKNFPSGVRKSISRSILRDGGPKVSTVGSGNTSNALFPAWRKTGHSSQKTVAASRLVPRPFWRQCNPGNPPHSHARRVGQEIQLPKI